MVADLDYLAKTRIPGERLVQDGSQFPIDTENIIKNTVYHSILELDYPLDGFSRILSYENNLLLYHKLGSL